MTSSHTSPPWPTRGLSFGADYNPEQWSPGVWRQDIRLMQQAGVNLVSLGIFSWGLVEVADGKFDWAWMDEVVGLLGEAGISIDLATPTAGPPGWLLHRHPEIRPLDHDMQPHWSGARLGWCPSSPVFRRYAVRIARAFSERYGRRDHVVMWHVGNEFGGGNGRCFCDVSAAAFRRWLQDRYGDLDALNEAWGTAFWGHTYRDFAHILPPRGTDSKNPSLVLDFDRFSSDELLTHYLAEREVLKRITPDKPVTTNFMVGAEPDVVDYARWAPSHGHPGERPLHTLARPAAAPGRGLLGGPDAFSHARTASVDADGAFDQRRELAAAQPLQEPRRVGAQQSEPHRARR